MIGDSVGNRVGSSFGALAALAILGLSAAVCSNAQVNPANEISGTVTDAAGKAISGAKVTLVGNRSSATTDAAGKYKLTVTATSLGNSGNSGQGSPAGSPGRAMDANMVQWMGGSLYFRFQEPSPAGRTGLFALSGAEMGMFPDARPTRMAYHAGYAAAKSAAASGDSLDVLAIGFERGGRAIASLSGTQDFKLKALSYNGILYKPGNNLSSYEKLMCTLDVHVPVGPLKKFPVIVHLHGGGLQEGDSQEGWTVGNMNNFVRKFYDQGYLIICPNYRLGIDPDLPNGGAPRGKWPDYLVDAAASVAWAKRHAEEYGGDTANFFVMGYSAGAWLSVMIALDTTYYKGAGMDPKAVSGYIPLSAQTYTYGEYAIEKGISDRSVSEGAALGHVRKLDIPMRMFVGGAEEAISHRVSDDSDFVKKMKAAGTTNLEMFVMPGRDHQHIVANIGNDGDETRALVLEFLKKYTR